VAQFKCLAVKKSDVIARFAASPTEFVELSNVERFGDGSGYCSRLRVSAGSFECTGRPFYFDSLEAFISDLRRGYERLSGTAELRHRYEHEFVKLEFTSLGHLVASGAIIDDGPPERRLEFAFQADQTVCPTFLRELDSMSGQLHDYQSRAADARKPLRG
jgi:hypothetical protein